LQVIEIEHQARRRWLMVVQKMGDLRCHRTGLPAKPLWAGAASTDARLAKATGGVDETVERTSDQNSCQNA
ncbi:MAG: hypothetical protein ACREFO_05170, partial [Acetobacteraceae bacterium]